MGYMRMREIKFRSWIYHEKVMVPVERLFLPVDGRLIGASNETRTIGINQKGKENDIEIMQYTGLKDKCGNEIYEGDIIRHSDEHEICTAIVKFEQYGYFLDWINVNALDSQLKNFQCSDELEIIGNIYENPELLDT